MSHLSWQSVKCFRQQVARLVHGLYSWSAMDCRPCVGLWISARYLSSSISRCPSMRLLPRRSSPFLCASTAQAWLCGDIMDATPFVAFMADNTYGIKDDFLDAVSFGGQPAEFLSFALSLRLNRNTRAAQMFLRQLKLLRSGKHTAKWFGPAAEEAYNLYRLMLLLCRSCADLFHHDEEVTPTGNV